MIYRHKTTGAVIDVESTMGGDWEPVKAPKHPAHATDPEAGKAAEQTTPETDQEAGKAEEQPATEKAVKKSGRGVRNSK